MRHLTLTSHRLPGQLEPRLHHFEGAVVDSEFNVAMQPRRPPGAKVCKAVPGRSRYVIYACHVVASRDARSADALLTKHMRASRV